VRVTTWAKGAGGYSTRATTGELVALERRGLRWLLLVAGEEVADLGLRASFDHAEGALLELTCARCGGPAPSAPLPPRSGLYTGRRLCGGDRCVSAS